MPLNFPEVWSGRVRGLLSTAHEARFLEGIPELDAEITTDELGEENIIHVPLETFAPDVLINNTTYPIDVQDHTDGTKSITLDKFQTKATRISEDAAIGASYNKIDSATRGHIRQINRTKYKKALHALAPAADTAKTPLILLAAVTADDVYNACVDMKGKFDAMEVPEDGRRVVLCADHYNVLLKSEKRYIMKLIDPPTGKITEFVAGFEVYQYIANPYYNAAGTKLAYGVVPNGTTDKIASVFFWMDNVGKKTGMTKQYYDKPTTTNQAHLVNYRHYYIALPLKNEAIGAMK